MEISVKEQSGETVETIQLDDAVFNVPMNNSLVHQALVIYQRRQAVGQGKIEFHFSNGCHLLEQFAIARRLQRILVLKLNNH